MSNEEIEIKQKTNAEQAAFPTELKLSNSADKGLTKLEYFAAAALQGILSNPEQIGGNTDYEWASDRAIMYANATLEKIKKIVNNNDKSDQT